MGGAPGRSTPPAPTKSQSASRIWGPSDVASRRSQRSRPSRHVHRRVGRALRRGRALDGLGHAARVHSAHASACRALRRHYGGRDRAAEGRHRPRCPARRARAGKLCAHRAAGGRTRSPGGHRRCVGARPARRQGRCRPRLEQRRADAVCAERRTPARPGEVVTGYAAGLVERRSLPATEPARTVTVVGVARPRHPVSQQTAIFLTDAEATRLAGHPGRVDAIGVLAAPGFDVSRLRAAAGGAEVLSGGARGAADYPELERTRTILIPVTAAFGGLAMFIAIFVVASTLGLSIQQREREIALMRAVAATPGQIRRKITWEAVIVGLVGAAAGIWPGTILGRELAQGLVD